MDEVTTISVTEFKAKCLKLFDALEKRKLRKIIVTRRGKPVGELTPPQTALPPLHGAHRGEAVVAPGVDLTEPVLDEDEFEAAHGILHR
jgi:antitoxin (DNA-binding transcriptional repressor) of toxin-antitoxin stability system